jgi:hypothetical protein
MVASFFSILTGWIGDCARAVMLIWFERWQYQLLSLKIVGIIMRSLNAELSISAMKIIDGRSRRAACIGISYSSCDKSAG